MSDDLEELMEKLNASLRNYKLLSTNFDMSMVTREDINKTIH